MRRAFVAVSLVAFALCCIACSGGKPPEKRTAFADEELQASREKIIQGMKERGIFKSVTRDNDTSGTVIVAPDFYALDMSDKQLFVGTAAGWIFKIPKGEKMMGDEFVHLEDSKTGKLVGSFSKEFGLELN